LKILIKSPVEDEQVLASVSFLRALPRHFEGAQFYLIENEKKTLAHEFLPLSIPRYQLPERLNSFLGVHKYSVLEPELFNIDMYFDLEGTFISSYLGRCFKARERYGFDRGLKSFFTNKKVELPLGGAEDEKLLKLLSHAVNDQDISSLNDGPTQSLNGSTDLLMLVLDLSLEGEEDTWVEFINEFEGQSFIIVELSGRPRLDLFYEKLSQKNSYAFEKYLNFARVTELCSKARGILSNERSIVYGLALYGISSFYYGTMKGYNLSGLQTSPILLSREKTKSLIVDEILDYLKI
jgi:hypothetical protein